MGNAGASHISIEFGIHGPSFTISTACSSATHAIGHAFWLVRSGAAPLAIAGGTFLFLGVHAVDGAWKSRGAGPAFIPALAGAAGAAILQQGLRMAFR